MTVERLSLMTGALALMGVAIAVLRRQSRATSCPRHSRHAGRIAMIIGWGALLAGAGLLVGTLAEWIRGMLPS